MNDVIAGVVSVLGEDELKEANLNFLEVGSQYESGLNYPLRMIAFDE